MVRIDIDTYRTTTTTVSPHSIAPPGAATYLKRPAHHPLPPHAKPRSQQLHRSALKRAPWLIAVPRLGRGVSRLFISPLRHVAIGASRTLPSLSSLRGWRAHCGAWSAVDTARCLLRFVAFCGSRGIHGSHTVLRRRIQVRQLQVGDGGAKSTGGDVVTIPSIRVFTRWTWGTHCRTRIGLTAVGTM